MEGNIPKDDLIQENDADLIQDGHLQHKNKNLHGAEMMRSESAWNGISIVEH